MLVLNIATVTDTTTNPGRVPPEGINSMKELVVISAKDGKGKTVLASGLFHLANDVVAVDFDIITDSRDEFEAHNFSRVIPNNVLEVTPYGLDKARINPHLCVRCGECLDACPNKAIRYSVRSKTKSPKVNVKLCDGCGTCASVCPEGGIQVEPMQAGCVYHTQTSAGKHLFYGFLQMGAGIQSSTVRRLRNLALQMAMEQPVELVISDGSLEISAPASASLLQNDLAIIVTEPTPLGFQDLYWMVELGKRFGVNMAVVINMPTMEQSYLAEVKGYVEEEGLPLLGLIPYDPTVGEAMETKHSVVETNPNGPAATAIKQIWDKLRVLLELKQPSLPVH